MKRSGTRFEATALGILLAIAASACGDDAGTPTDAGTPADAGTPTDGGTPLDGATPGMETRDGGTPHDAGTTPGMETRDGGTPDDAGTTPEDASTPPVDADVDGGGIDSGELDSGTTADAGMPLDGSDAGMPDAGAPDDAGTTPADAGVDGGGINMARLDGLSAEIATTVCGALARCCNAESQVRYFAALRENGRFAAFRDRLPPAATLNETQCIDVMTQIFDIQPFGSWVEAARAGRVTLVETELDACIAELDTVACGPGLTRALFDGECLGYNPPEGGESQRRMFARTARAGQSCSAITDGFGGALYGSCDPEVAFCCYPADRTCGLPTAAVRNGTCAAVAPVGAECSAGPPVRLCATGQFCNDAGRCQTESTTALALGQMCLNTAFEALGICAEGTYCDVLGTRRCTARRADGATCGTSDECTGGLCQGGMCATDRTCAGPST